MDTANWTMDREDKTGSDWASEAREINSKKIDTKEIFNWWWQQTTALSQADTAVVGN